VFELINDNFWVFAFLIQLEEWLWIELVGGRDVLHHSRLWAFILQSSQCAGLVRGLVSSHGDFMVQCSMRENTLWIICTRFCSVIYCSQGISLAISFWEEIACFLCQINFFSKFRFVFHYHLFFKPPVLQNFWIVRPDTRTMRLPLTLIQALVPELLHLLLLLLFESLSRILLCDSLNLFLQEGRIVLSLIA